MYRKNNTFFVITTIDNKEEYDQQLKTFVEHVKEFYNIGKRSFLTKVKSKVGGDETFYLHCLRYYMPRIAKDTLEKHKLGLGIYTM